jgi:hypothetical protein
MPSPAIPSPLYNHTQKVRKFTTFKANKTIQNLSILHYKTELIKKKKKGYWTKTQHCGQRKCICISNAIKSARS